MDGKVTSELLSPAGSFEAALAAFQFGADAIYLGLGSLSARAEAVNFSADDLARICAYAHSLSPRRSVYAAINTLVRDDEIDEAILALDATASAGVDAVIVQDFAVFDLIRRHFPSLKAHASTQMAIHNLEGAVALRDLGFSRVVLARELSFDEIRRITAEAGVETEVFVHGALCYGYSGLCLFSAFRTGRSGNRGRCAYCCRGEFHAPGDAHGSYPFSMRDLFLLDHVRDLRDAGVASLKVEGRMKSPLYVASVTDLYRRELDGAFADARERNEAISDVRTVFSRPATSLYFDGASSPDRIIDPCAVGHRGALVGQVRSVRRDERGARWLRFAPQRPLEVHDGLQVEFPGMEGGRPFGFAIDRMRLAGERRDRFDVPSESRIEVLLPRDAPVIPDGAQVFCASSQAVKRRFAVRTPRDAELRAALPVAFKVTLDPGGISCEADAGGVAVRRSIPATLGPARNPDMTADAVRKAFSRLGDTRWSATSVDVEDPLSLYAPASVLNEARRAIVADLDAERAAAHDKAIADVRAAIAVASATPISPTLPQPPRRSVKVRIEANMPRCDGFDETVVALSCEACRDVAALSRRIAEWKAACGRLRLSLPLVMRHGESDLCAAAVSALADAGFKDWECCDVSGLSILRRLSDGRFSITADGSLYSFNGLSARFLRSMGVAAAVAPFEMDDEQLLDAVGYGASWFMVPVRFRPNLFISETRPMDGSSSNAIALEDRSRRRFETAVRDGRWITRDAAPIVRDETRFAAAGFSMFRHDLT